jgi:hypothetical protein
VLTNCAGVGWQFVVRRHLRTLGHCQLLRHHVHAEGAEYSKGKLSNLKLRRLKRLSDVSCQFASFSWFCVTK